jgi:hypothetical protein
MAPIWSIASCRPNPHPCPTSEQACESITSRAGVRNAFPILSVIKRTAAISHLPASARSGTASKFIKYPVIVIAQYLRFYHLDIQKQDAGRNQ